MDDSAAAASAADDDDDVDEEVGPPHAISHCFTNSSNRPSFRLSALSFP